ncbi:MAG: hypothetical protein MUP30_04705 [Deltaproteobacteria bacterium]|nr:hypothetical protein [Deltaproteobacteria bacterium]
MIKKLSNDIYNLFTITYKKAGKKIINIIKTMEDLPKEVTSYFREQKKGHPWFNLYINDFLFHSVLCLIVGGLLTLFIELSKNEDVTKFLGISPTPFLIITILFLLVIAGFVLHRRLKRMQERNEEFKNISEITNLSYHTIFDFFIRNMKSIKQATDSTAANTFLQEYNEQKLFKTMAKALGNFIKKLFPDEFGTIIEIFKFNDNKLSPIVAPLINNSFKGARKNAEFIIPEKVADCESLAAFAFLTNKIQYNNNIKKKLNIIEGLSEDQLKKLKDEENFYLKKDEVAKNFILGTILYFPLTDNGYNFGLLSIGFVEQNIERYLKSIGVTIEDFKRCISIFIENYTKFSVVTDQAIKNYFQLISK